MKRAIFIFAILLSVFAVSITTAQSGYKDYTWGMTVEQVKAKCPNIRYYENIYWSAPMHVLLYLYKNEIAPSEWLDPSSYDEAEVTIYDFINDKPYASSYIASFYFINDKLVAVEVEFCDKSILPELEKQYGKVIPIHCVHNATYIYDTAAWHDNKGRFIVWEKRYVEDVTYINAKWLTPLMNKAITEYREKEAYTKSLID